MSGLVGGSLVDMRTLGQHFTQDADTLQTLIDRLNSDTGASGTIWTGPRADRFRSDWQGFQPSLRQLVAALQDAGRAVGVNADNIEAATS